MVSCFGRTSQWDKSVGVHDINAEENLFTGFLKMSNLPSLVYCSHDISHLQPWSHMNEVSHQFSNPEVPPVSDQFEGFPTLHREKC